MGQSGLETSRRGLGTLARLDTVTTFPGTPDAPLRSPAAPGRHRAAPLTAPPVARRAQSTSPVLQGLIALATYLAVSLTYAPARRMLADPSVLHLTGRNMDPAFFVWMLRQYFGLPCGGIWNLPFLRDAYPVRLTVFAYLALAVMTAIFLADSARNDATAGALEASDVAQEAPWRR